MIKLTKKAIAFASGAMLLGGAAFAQEDEDRYAYVGTSMFGDQEVGHKGAGDKASGDFSAELDLVEGKMCYMLELDGLKDFAAAHIHKAKVGENGPPVVTLELPAEGADDPCVDVDAKLLKDIAENGADYYVNVHTKRFPQGAVRGQLGQ